jgi:molybdenum cofactor biosynthesis protein B
MGSGRHKSHLSISLSVAVLTVSDTRTTATDQSGATLQRLLAGAGHRLADYRIVPDEPEAIRPVLDAWLRDETVEAIITTGGTGIAGRDRTCEVVDNLLDKRLDGFGELFRMLSYEAVGSAAMLSRAIGGVAGGRPIFALPGSPAAVELALDRLILPELGHLMAELTRDA